MASRTTLTLEDDVVERLRAEAWRTGKPMKTIVNDAIRAGLAGRKKPAPFKVEARPMGLRPGFDFDDIWGLIEKIEGPFHR